MLDKNNEVINMPDDPTIDDLVSFLIEYGKGVYTAEDYQIILNSPIPTMDKSTMLYNINMQAAKNEDEKLFLRDLFMQYEMRKIHRYLNRIDKILRKRKVRRGREYLLGKIRKKKEVILTGEPEIKSQVDQYLNLLDAVTTHWDAFQNYHIASRQHLYQTGKECLDIMSEAGVLIGDKDELAKEYMKLVNAAPSIPEQLEQLEKNHFQVEPEHFLKNNVLMDEIRLFSFHMNHCDKDKLLEISEKQIEEKLATKAAEAETDAETKAATEAAVVDTQAEQELAESGGQQNVAETQEQAEKSEATGQKALEATKKVPRAIGALNALLKEPTSGYVNETVDVMNKVAKDIQKGEHKSKTIPETLNEYIRNHKTVHEAFHNGSIDATAAKTAPEPATPESTRGASK